MGQAKVIWNGIVYDTKQRTSTCPSDGCGNMKQTKALIVGAGPGGLTCAALLARRAKAYKGEFKGKNFGYLGHEIYLLPGQMIPEHSHVGNGGKKGFGPKMESWHVRHGTVEFFGEHKGAGDEMLISDMPEDERPFGYGEPWFKSKYVVKRTAGQIYSLEDAETWHFQRAGKNGAIVAEYATYHNHVEFSKPGMEFANSEDR